MRMLGWVLTILGWYVVAGTTYSAIVLASRLLPIADYGEKAPFVGAHVVMGALRVLLTRSGKRRRTRTADPLETPDQTDPPPS